MSTSDHIRLVQALIRAGSQEHIPRQDDLVPSGAVVTLSRMYGSGGLEIARQLAARLKVRCFDSELLDRIVEDAKVDRYLMEQLDEKVRGGMSDWIYTILTGKSVFAEDYRRHLFNVVLGIAKRGGVIVGRGAHLILANRPDVLRLRIVASHQSCVERVAGRENISREEAERRVAEVERDREVFLNALFKTQVMSPASFDLTINSDSLSQDHIIELIVSFLQAKRMEKLPKSAAS